MAKKIIILAALLVFIGIGFWIYQASKENSVSEESGELNISKTNQAVLDPKNCIYLIEGQEVTLRDGYSQVNTVPGSASKVTTQYFGNTAQGDFNNDGVNDVAFILTQDTEGSGTFYYQAAALSNSIGCIGTNAILLGDRIAPQSSSYTNGKIVVNYADRNPGEPMTIRPSLGVSKYFTVNNGQLVEENQ